MNLEGLWILARSWPHVHEIQDGNAIIPIEAISWPPEKTCNRCALEKELREIELPDAISSQPGANTDVLCCVANCTELAAFIIDRRAFCARHRI